MDQLLNPFTPGAGSRPYELAGRQELIEQAKLLMGRTLLGRFEKSMIMVGLRGVGKTVLLAYLEEKAKEAGYSTIAVECHEGKELPALLASDIRRILLNLDRVATANEIVKRGLRVAKSLFNGFKISYAGAEISVDSEPGVADSGDIEIDLPDALSALAEAARARGTGVAMLIDEMQYLSDREFSALIMAMQRVAKTNAPLILIGAGLPQIPGLAGDSKSYAERLFNFPRVGPLASVDIEHALADPVIHAGAVITREAVAKIATLTEGYPYFIQEWGYHSWKIAPDKVIDRASVDLATSAVIRRLDEAFFRVRFDRLTPQEKNYLRALAELGAGVQRSGDVAEVLGSKSQKLGPIRDRLIKKGMIYSPSHGDTEFTVPLFDAFMKRAIPELPSQKDLGST